MWVISLCLQIVQDLVDVHIGQETAAKIISWWCTQGWWEQRAQLLSPTTSAGIPVVALQSLQILAEQKPACQCLHVCRQRTQYLTMQFDWWTVEWLLLTVLWATQVYRYQIPVALVLCSWLWLSAEQKRFVVVTNIILFCHHPLFPEVNKKKKSKGQINLLSLKPGKLQDSKTSKANFVNCAALMEHWSACMRQAMADLELWNKSGILIMLVSSSVMLTVRDMTKKTIVVIRVCCVCVSEPMVYGSQLPWNEERHLSDFWWKGGGVTLIISFV